MEIDFSKFILVHLLCQTHIFFDGHTVEYHSYLPKNILVIKNVLLILNLVRKNVTKNQQTSPYMNLKSIDGQ